MKLIVHLLYLWTDIISISSAVRLWYLLFFWLVGWFYGMSTLVRLFYLFIFKQLYCFK